MRCDFSDYSDPSHTAVHRCARPLASLRARTEVPAWNTVKGLVADLRGWHCLFALSHLTWFYPRQSRGLRAFLKERRKYVTVNIFLLSSLLPGNGAMCNHTTLITLPPPSSRDPKCSLNTLQPVGLIGSQSAVVMGCA